MLFKQPPFNLQVMVPFEVAEQGRPFSKIHMGHFTLGVTHLHPDKDQPRKI